MNFYKILELSHQLIRERVKTGDIVIDATLGRGKDTVFLANLVGDNGKVYGFDIQKEAIDSTRKILEEEQIIDRVEIIFDSHEKLKVYIDKPVKAVMFNLGYLPSGNKDIITKDTSSIKAIKAALNLLEDDGIITVVVYIEHDDGLESRGINDFLTTLPQNEVSVIKYQFINQINYPSYLVAIEKVKK